MGLTKEQRQQLKQQLSQHSPLWALLEMVKAEELELHQSFVSINFSSLDGQQQASELKGRIQGMRRFQDLLEEQLKD
jgi:hypothetical protein